MLMTMRALLTNALFHVPWQCCILLAHVLYRRPPGHPIGTSILFSVFLDAANDAGGYSTRTQPLSCLPGTATSDQKQCCLASDVIILISAAV